MCSDFKVLLIQLTKTYQDTIHHTVRNIFILLRSDIKALRNLYENCEIQICSLASMGVVCDSYGSLLCLILVTLFAEEMTLKFSRKVEEGDV